MRASCATTASVASTTRCSAAGTAGSTRCRRRSSRAKLPHLENWTERRRQLATLYDEALSGSAAVTPIEAEGRRHAYHLYVVRAPDREGLQRRLQDEGIGTAIHYPRPVHLHPAYEDLGGNHLGTSERLSGEILSLPLYPELQDAEVEAVAAAVARLA